MSLNPPYKLNNLNVLLKQTFEVSHFVNKDTPRKVVKHNIIKVFPEF